MWFGFVGINFLSMWIVEVWKIFYEQVFFESFVVNIELLCGSAENELQTVASIILPGYRVSSDAKDDTFSHKFPFKVQTLLARLWKMHSFWKTNFSFRFCPMVLNCSFSYVMVLCVNCNCIGHFVWLMLA